MNQEDSLLSYLVADVEVADIEALKTAQSCTPLFVFLKELVRTQLPDFWIKIAVLLILARDKHQTIWTPQELSVELKWLRESHRKRVVMQLSRSNWLHFDDGSYSLSTFGRNIIASLTTLIHQQQIPESLGTNVSSMAIAEMYQHDPTNTLRMFLNELVRIDDNIQKTLNSKSEYLIRRLNKQIRTQFQIAVKSREHLQNLATDDFKTYRLKQQIHERLSSFHARLSQIQRIQNDLVARKIILADKSLTQHDINDFLINSSVDKLANLSKKFISPPIRLPDLIPPLMVYETEWQLEKDFTPQKRRGWSLVENATEREDNLVSQSRFAGFVGEIEHNLAKKTQIAIEEFIPGDSWGTSSFRFSMLPVMESGELPVYLQEPNSPKISRIKIAVDDSIQPVAALLNDHLSGVKEISIGIVSKARE